MVRVRSYARGLLLPAVLAAFLGVSAIAEEPSAKTSEVSAHPLLATVRYATSRSVYIRENIRDYSCRLIKRERINGELQEHQFARVKVRCEQRLDDRVVQPTAVFMQFLGPRRIKDRRILYIAGKNDGMVLVRKGGNVMKYLKLTVDPNGHRAKQESNHPITDVGFDKIIDRLIQRAKDDIDRDPSGGNTSVSYFRDANVNGRQCTHVRVVHPKQSDGMEFHIASLYVDDELHVPIRLVVYGWPKREGEKPPIDEEYTYLDLRLNVGLTDADFSESQLESSASPQSTTASNLSR